MDIEVAKKLILKYTQGHADFIARALTADRYYAIKNDIVFRKPKYQDSYDNNGAIINGRDPLRHADNKVPFSFYQLLVNQKSSYMFTAPPMLDVKDDKLNQYITDCLGDAFARNCKNLCVNASNAGVAWVHYWHDEQEGFTYAVIPSTQIIPVWSTKIDHKLLAVLRVYRDVDENGDYWDVYEYWNDTECQAFTKPSADDFDGLRTCPLFTDFYLAGLTEADNVLHHNYDQVPFIPFFNNSDSTSDLAPIKALIDTYDKTFSGFVDDLEDIQQVILVLTNYGGEDMTEFMNALKYYKTVALDSVGDGDKSGISTLNIEIPVEARDKLLELTRKAIFSMGQGVDPEQQGLNTTSGEAMKFLYALLELKAGLMETEFRLGFNELVRAILKDCGAKAKSITQTWTRTSIKNDAELAAMCSQSVGIISKKTILKNHPFVENAEDEEKQLEKEAQEETQAADIYPTFEGGEAGDLQATN